MKTENVPRNCTEAKSSCQYSPDIKLDPYIPKNESSQFFKFVSKVFSSTKVAASFFGFDDIPELQSIVQHVDM